VEGKPLAAMATEQFSLADSTAIVTGASRGIGKMIAKRFAEDGVDVVICSRDFEHVGPVADAIAGSDAPGDTVAVECDVRERDAVDEMVQTAIDEFGSLDLLVNNAGGSFQAQFEEISENGWNTLVELNLHGTYNCTQAAAEPMKETGGAIVNMGSIRGQEGSPKSSPYGAAKAGIINFTRTLAYEWAQYDVRVNCIAPGFIATPGIAETRNLDLDVEGIDRETVDREIGTPAEVADVVQFLASPAASFMTGETVTVRGVPPIVDNPLSGD
jgi:NAD(P)-dependent dehydrogenase (short-subunit alcohol dehydrogenase family)